MNLLTDLIFIFVFLYIMFLFKIPDITTDNFILHKFFLYISLFLFNFVTQVIIKIKNNCKIDQNELLSKSIEVAVSGVIGYSIFIDLSIMEYTKDYIEYLTRSKYMLYLISSIIIILFISIIKIIKLLFNYNENECITQNKTEILDN